MQDEDLKDLAEALTGTARRAGAVILRYRDSSSQVDYKADGSPVTAADKAAEEIILSNLSRLAPGVAVVAEESVGALDPAFDPEQPFFLVDPLDGTKDFVRGGEDFTVNIALVRAREPLFGLIYAPASERLYMTRMRGEAVAALMEPSDSQDTFALSETTPIWTRDPDPAGLTVLASRSHMNEETAEVISRLNVAETLQFSSSRKFCVIAEGKADLYPRLAPTSEWDTAAGQAILCAAGGSVVMKDGAALTYGHVERRFLNPGFLAWGRGASALDSAAAKL